MSFLSIKDAPLKTSIVGDEKIPTGGYGDLAITVQQIKDFTALAFTNVDNTSDLDKPISTATQAALDLKANVSNVNTSLALKSDKTYVDDQLSLKASKIYVDTELQKTASKTYVDNQLATKASTTYVDSINAQKANISYVDSELALKSDIAYVDNVASTKADKATTLSGYGITNAYTKTEVDSSITAVAGGHKAYQTLAAAQAAQASLPVNTIVEVTNDATTANNGAYQWNGTTLTKSAYDPLTQSQKYTDEKTKYVSGYRGVNIADLSDALDGYYVNYLSGEIGDNAGFVATNYLEISGGVEYRVPDNYVQQFAFYDENKAYISGLVSADINHKFTTPANAKYVRFSVEKVQLSGFMVAKASEYPLFFTPYQINLNDLSINSSQVNNLFNDVRGDLGIKTVNIIDPVKVGSGYYVNYITGEIGDVVGYSATDFIEVAPNTEYQTSSFYNQQFAFYDANGVYISGQPYPINSKFTTPANAKYARFTITDDQLNTLIISEKSIFPSYYVPHSVKTIENFIFGDIKTTEIIVSADVNDASAQFVGKNAIQLALDSITDATEKNRYRIIAKGIFKVDTAVDFIGYIGYPSMILAKDYVEIIGNGNTVVSAELPYDDAAIGLSVDGGNYPRIQYQTLYTYAKDALIQDIKFIAKNIRYAVHLDNPAGANKRHDFKNVSFIFKGDKGSQQALGCGTSTGEETYFYGGECHSDVGNPFYCHNNSKFIKPSVMSFNGYKFSSNTYKYAIVIQSDGSLVSDKFEIVGCSFDGAAYAINYSELWLKKDTSQNYDSFNHAEWKFSGYGNSPFLFDNFVGGESLRIKTNAAGVGNTIRFDKNSSAYSVLVKNNQTNSDVDLYTDGHEYIDGYIVKDGSVGLPAEAIGCLDVSEAAGLYDSGVIYTSIGKRLGDCSTVNKALGIIVNGVTNTVTFNKDYTAMTNTAILAEINTALSGATADLYSYGRDYYPMLTDVAETAYNTGLTYIPKGSVVTKSGGTVRLANGNDKVFGVALDEIPVMQTTADGSRKGQGRVLKRGYISANTANAHFVLADNQNPAVGTRFSVSNGQLLTDVNGKISVDIDTSVISINC